MVEETRDTEQQVVIDTFWQKAKQAADKGENEVARAWLEGIVQLDDDDVDAWLRLADLIPDARERMHCYVHVLEISPGNAQARNGIRKTRRQL
jgi:thioredoxin-like negative regulator of GroEL